VALDHAFVLLTLLCLTTAAAAGVLRTGSDRAPHDEMAPTGG
ncbi:MFS transporter, partial [Streptomyces populi]